MSGFLGGGGGSGTLGIGSSVGGGLFGFQNGVLGFLLKGGIVRQSGNTPAALIQAILTAQGESTIAQQVGRIWPVLPGRNKAVQATLSKGESPMFARQRLLVTNPGGTVYLGLNVADSSLVVNDYYVILVSAQSDASDPTSYIYLTGMWPTGSPTKAAIAFTSPKTPGLYVGIVVLNVTNGGASSYLNLGPLYLRLVGSQGSSTVQPFRPVHSSRRHQVYNEAGRKAAAETINDERPTNKYFGPARLGEIIRARGGFDKTSDGSRVGEANPVTGPMPFEGRVTGTKPGFRFG